MKINYDNRVFKPVSNSENEETSSETQFYYKQKGNLLTSEYAGGQIKRDT
ncbi:hypothetical protein [Aquimarina sp. U1-2]|nr:hypothetical protein [Aquimarina sp. U1-2]